MPHGLWFRVTVQWALDEISSTKTTGSSLVFPLLCIQEACERPLRFCRQFALKAIFIFKSEMYVHLANDQQIRL